MLKGRLDKVRTFILQHTVTAGCDDVVANIITGRITHQSMVLEWIGVWDLWRHFQWSFGLANEVYPFTQSPDWIFDMIWLYEAKASELSSRSDRAQSVRAYEASH